MKIKPLAPTKTYATRSERVTRSHQAQIQQSTLFYNQSSESFDNYLAADEDAELSNIIQNNLSDFEDQSASQSDTVDISTYQNLVEQAGGISPPTSHKTVRETLTSYGSYCPVQRVK